MTAKVVCIVVSKIGTTTGHGLRGEALAKPLTKFA
jgi:hypothetical protein